jgi:HPt (histidine-containing phosphotransfer) domain-containing protein
VEQALSQGDIASASDVLHRLRASCGFVGAAALGAAVRALQADPESMDALRRFGACVDAVLALAGGAIA